MNSYFGKPYSQWTDDEKKEFDLKHSKIESYGIFVDNLVENIKNDENFFDFF